MVSFLPLQLMISIVTTMHMMGQCENTASNASIVSLPIWNSNNASFPTIITVEDTDVHHNRYLQQQAPTPVFQYVITTVVGTGTAGYSGDNGAATNAQLNNPYGLAFDGSSNLYISDYSNNRVRMLALGTGIITTYAGRGTAGYSGDNGVATSAQLNGPQGMAFDAQGNLYIADFTNNRIRMIVTGSNIISTYAGTGTAGYSGDNGAATSATLKGPQGLAFDAQGNLYIADYSNQRVRVIAKSGAIITTYAGTGTAGYSGDNNIATIAQLNGPSALAFDGQGNLYIAEYSNQRVRVITLTTQIITTYVGTGTQGFSGDLGAATNANLYNPKGLTFDGQGNLYSSDYSNCRIRVITSSSNSITTYVGTGTAGYSGDNGAATNAQLKNPVGLVVDGLGVLYIADFTNNRIRAIKYTSSCAIGYYVSGSACVACPSGTYSPASTVLGVAACLNCLPGTYSASSASTTCATCAVGYYAGSSGASTCTPCPGGSVSTVTGATTCALCSANTYALAGSSICSFCSFGLYSPAGSQYCSNCQAGTYATSASVCTSCAAGSYSNSLGQTACAPCPAGVYSSTGASSCSACAAGNFVQLVLLSCISLHSRCHDDNSLFSCISSHYSYVITVGRYLFKHQRIWGMCILSCRSIVIARINFLLQLRCWLLRELIGIIIVHALPHQHVQPQHRRHVVDSLSVLC